MSRISIANQRAEIAGLLTDPIEGVTQFYDHEPKSVAKPVSLTLFYGGSRPDHHIWFVRLYVTADVDVEAAQQTIDTVVPLVEDRLSSPYGPSNWDVVGPSDDVPFFRAVWTLEVGREDF